MIHSASFLATGSDIAASVWVASAGLCLRTSSMTFSSASVSACEVDDVAATAAGVTGLRAGGGKAACWRVAGAIAAGAAVVTGAVFLAELAGAILREIGRGLGNGTFALAEASPAKIENPIASTRLVANAVDCNAAARAWV